jgi:hypothetical protein
MHYTTLILCSLRLSIISYHPGFQLNVGHVYNFSAFHLRNSSQPPRFQHFTNIENSANDEASRYEFYAFPCSLSLSYSLQTKTNFIETKTF